jgi:hypothetical protein
MIEKFSAFIDNSTHINIAFGNRLDTNQTIIDTTISKSSEVESIKNFIAQSGERDTCYHLSGTITFLNASEEGFMIDFGLDPGCPAYYFYTDDNTVSFRMSYRSGTYLSELQQLLLKSRPE